MRLFLAAVFAVSCIAGTVEDQQFNGRWDITVKGDNAPRAWWLEVSGAGTDSIKGKFVGAPGRQLDDIPKISVYDGELRFTFDRRYRQEPRVPRDPKSPLPPPPKPPLQRGLYWARLDNGKLKGTFEIEGEPATYLEWIGVRAPVIKDADDGAWKKGDPINLFDGHDMTGWSPVVSGKPAWTVKQGILTNATGASDLETDKKFWNFVLHVEYRVGVGGSSGIGLRGRYEVQIMDDAGRPPATHGNGAIYGRIAPLINATKDPGEWQAFEIRLVGRQVSISLNGIRIMERQTIDGLTSIATDANEGDPGPILLQGDRGIVEFRKIVLFPLTKTH
jgi:hypothetical protein